MGVNMPIQDDGVQVLDALEKFTVFYVRIPAVSGIVKLREDSVPTEVRRRMPKDLFSLEARVFDREAIRVPGKLKMRLTRALTRLGTPFLSGYLISSDLAEEARNEIAKTADEYEAWVQPFLNKVEPLIDIQCSKFPEWGDMIRRAAPTREEIEKKLTFKKSSFQVRGGTPEEINDLTSELSSLPQQIAREFADLVEENWSEMNGDRSTQRFRRTLNDIRRKAKSLSYLHPKLRDLVDLIDEITAKVPAMGVITGADYALFRGLRAMLLDPSEILGDQRVFVADVPALPATTPAQPQQAPSSPGAKIQAPSASNIDSAVAWVI